jgi:hypothetical protein
MEYQIRRHYHNGYIWDSSEKQVPLTKFVDHVERQAPIKRGHCVGTVTTVVQRRSWAFLGKLLWSEKDLHLLALDIDGQDCTIAAASYLKREDIRYVPVVSSPTHCWLITDFVGTFKEVEWHLSRCPGVDQKFVDISTKRQRLHLRAYSLPGREVEFPEDITELRSPLARKWLTEFRAVHQRLQGVLANAMLRQALEDGTMLELAADPNFDV